LCNGFIGGQAVLQKSISDQRAEGRGRGWRVEGRGQGGGKAEDRKSYVNIP